jgi:hypothetical protein
MKLWKTLHASGYYAIQLNHNKIAIETAISCIESIHAQESTNGYGDMVDSGFIDTMRDWLIETLLQGAYIREYHIWEKNVKEYCNIQWALNGNLQPCKWKSKKSESFIDKTKERLSEFSASVPLDAINIMREKTNTAKHCPGLLTEHFVTRAEYDEAIRAIEVFWETLGQQETYRPRSMP